MAEIPRPRVRAQSGFTTVSASVLLVSVLLVTVTCGGDSVGLDAPGGVAPDSDDVGSDASDGDTVGGNSDTGSGYDPAADMDLERLPIDDSVVVGRLENGLSYYLRSNESPGGQVEVRLVVRAGSADDPKDASGAAHFLEHMVFRGTEGYPGGSLRGALRDLGVQLGPDANAYTSWDATVYQVTVLTERVLPFPADGSVGGDGAQGGNKAQGVGGGVAESDGSVGGDGAQDGDGAQGVGGGVGAVLEILAEMASVASIDPGDVDSERGVILDEYSRLAASGRGRVRRAV